MMRRLFLRGRRLRSGWRAGLYLMGYLLGLLIVETPALGLYAGYLMAQGVRSAPDLLARMLPDRLPIGFTLALKAAELAMLLPLTALFCRTIDRRQWIGLGFGRGRGWQMDLLLGLGLGGAQMLAVLGIEWAGGWVSVGVPDRAALIDGLEVGVWAAGLFLVVAAGEELIFRGYLHVNLCEGMGSLPALMATSLLFGAFHAMNPHFSWLALLNVALAGLSLGYGRVVTGALWLPMAYHLSWNFTQGALLSLPVSGVRYGGLLEVTDLGTAPLITGAAFGPEGGWICTLILASSFPVLWAWGRWRSTDRPGR